MPQLTLKQQIIENVNRLPDDASVNAILEELEDILDTAADEEAIEEQEDDPWIPLSEIKKEFGS